MLGGRNWLRALRVWPGVEVDEKIREKSAGIGSISVVRLPMEHASKIL